MLEQHVKVAVVPSGGMGGPCALDAAGHGITANATGLVVDPAKTLVLDAGTFGRRAKIGRVAIAVCLAHGVTASGQGHGFLVVHGHAGEGHTHVPGGLERIRLAIDPFRVHIDQAHHHRGQRVLEVAFARIARSLTTAGCQPFLFRTPVDVLLGVPDVFAAKAKAKRLEAHRLIRHVAGEDDQVGPADLVAVLLLDRPQQATGLVEVAVVRPRVQRGKTLVAGTTTTTTVGHAIGPGRVPGHADHQAAIVAPVGRPPRLAVGHQGLEVGLQRLHVEFLEFFAVVEARTHRIGLGVVLVQDVQVQCVWPPGHHRVAACRIAAVHHRALARGVVFAHIDLLMYRSIGPRWLMTSTTRHLPAHALSGGCFRGYRVA
ncbi:hypothetical protein SDC9_119179 [bioreactor metagenome]|uniref:Uncharacterized protein n=1 Tax=bioreactor metagenome TaxID=1076179 RepID=A0A645C314_9ZZZZ